MEWRLAVRAPGIFGAWKGTTSRHERSGEAGLTDLSADAVASFLFRLSLGRLRPRRARLRFTGEER